MDIVLSLQDIQARAQRHVDMDVLPHFSSFTWPQLRQGFWHCTPQCGINKSRTAPASLLRPLVPLGKFCLFPWGQFACLLPAMPEIGRNVRAYSQKVEKGLCSVLGDSCAQHTKQQGKVYFCKFIYKMVQFTPLLHLLCPCLDSHLLSKSQQCFHCRARTSQRLLHLLKHQVIHLSSGFWGLCTGMLLFVKCASKYCKLKYMLLKTIF